MPIRFATDVMDIVDRIVTDYYGPFDIMVEFHTVKQYKLKYLATMSSTSRTISVTLINTVEYVVAPLYILRSIYDMFQRLDSMNYVEWDTISRDYQRELKNSAIRHVKRLANKPKGDAMYDN